MPPNTVYVGRPTQWGNPFIIGDLHHADEATRAELVERYRRALLNGELVVEAHCAREFLRGKDLACWCREGQPCHADVLLEVANR
jgi:hypothetical protein